MALALPVPRQRFSFQLSKCLISWEISAPCSIFPVSYEQKKCRIEIPKKSFQTSTKEYASSQPALVALTALWKFIFLLFQVIPGRCWETETEVGAMGK